MANVAELRARLRQVEKDRARLADQLQRLRDHADKLKAANEAAPLALRETFLQVQTAAENADVGIRALRDQIAQVENPRPLPSYARGNA